MVHPRLDLFLDYRITVNCNPIIINTPGPAGTGESWELVASAITSCQGKRLGSSQGHPSAVKIPRAVAVVTEGSRVLVIKRFLRQGSSAVCVMCEDGGEIGEHCPGHRYAVLPGGHVEEGEAAEMAAVRELAEETGLQATIERQLWTGRHNGRPAFYFLMAGATGTPVLSGPEAAENGPDNSFELSWVTADQFEELNLHPAGVRSVLTDLLAR